MLLQTNFALQLKVIIIGVMIVVKAVHDFWVGPRAAELPPGGSWWNTAMYLGRINFILGLAVLYLAVELD